tara:strand:+ start:1342 stop:1722 length:381 start_codon:yes stop_codon:yes gene_type:complete
MEEVNIHNLELEIKGHVDRNIVDIGSLTLSVDDREYILDVTQSYSDETENFSGEPILRITCDLEVDKDTFEDCPYDITKHDLLDADHNDLNAELYVGGEEDFEVEQILLHFDIDGQDYQIKVKEEI